MKFVKIVKSWYGYSTTFCICLHGILMIFVNGDRHWASMSLQNLYTAAFHKGNNDLPVVEHLPKWTENEQNVLKMQNISIAASPHTNSRKAAINRVFLRPQFGFHVYKIQAANDAPKAIIRCRLTHLRLLCLFRNSALCRRFPWPIKLISIQLRQ